MTTYADNRRLAYVGSKPGSKESASDAWFTPEEYVEAARLSLGSIDLDPFSDAHANKRIKAARFHDGAAYGDAFTEKWKGRNIWMNPPYSRGLCAKAVGALLKALSEGPCNAIVLVNNATDVKWWKALSDSPYCQALCLTNHRISFSNIDGKNSSGNTRGQAFWLLSSAKRSTERSRLVSRFRVNFGRYGKVWKGML